MPELPEVETVRRELEERIIGHKIIGCEIYRPDYLRGCGCEDFVLGCRGETVSAVARRGKYLIWELSGGAIISHLGMTGKFMMLDDSQILPKHTVAKFDFGDFSLLLNDVRRFGRLKYYRKGEQIGEFLHLGAEPFSEDLKISYLKDKLSGRKRPIKALLLDQSIIAGLGNIYASEILFRARIHPLKSGGELSSYKIRRTIEEIRIVLGAAIENAGTTISDYRRVDEKSGGFQEFLQVYGKEGESCPVCRSKIKKIILGGRSSFYCPRCQKK